MMDDGSDLLHSASLPSPSAPPGMHLSPAAQSLVEALPGAASCRTWIRCLHTWLFDVREAEAEDIYAWRPLGGWAIHCGFNRAIHALAEEQRDDVTPKWVEPYGPLACDEVHDLGAGERSDLRRGINAVHGAALQAEGYASSEDTASVGSDEDLSIAQDDPQPASMISFRTERKPHFLHVTAVISYKAWNAHDMAEVERLIEARDAASHDCGPGDGPSPGETPQAQPSAPPTCRAGLSSESLHFDGLAQHLADLETSHALCGTRLGLFVLNSRFQRTAILPCRGREVIFVEVAIDDVGLDTGGPPSPTLRSAPPLHFGLERMPNRMRWQREYSDEDTAPGSPYYRLWKFLCVAIALAAEDCARDACPSTSQTPQEWVQEVQQLFAKDTSLVRWLESDSRGSLGVGRGTETSEPEQGAALGGRSASPGGGPEAYDGPGDQARGVDRDEGETHGFPCPSSKPTFVVSSSTMDWMVEAISRLGYSGG